MDPGCHGPASAAQIPNIEPAGTTTSFSGKLCMEQHPTVLLGGAHAAMASSFGCHPRRHVCVRWHHITQEAPASSAAAAAAQVLGMLGQRRPSIATAVAREFGWTSCGKCRTLQQVRILFAWLPDFLTFASSLTPNP